ncbi:hypothetical protein BaOVIS_000150 [Babesia ovis]|uniref:Uncharacterized protein n=1 Tax=Babesia ovis TaxID=5869 RepID=A0A9W5T8C1_BABOV|nr:hypothetical protein BaOVIS_000150 [Babesia ovis]
MSRTVSITSASGRGSVLDTLMLRPATEHADYMSSDMDYGFVQSGCNTPLVSSNASSDCDVDSLVSTALSPQFDRGTTTPTTRSEQLAILLSRNYHSAPACSLDFIALTSSLRLHNDVERDSEKTLVESPVGHAMSPMDPGSSHNWNNKANTHRILPDDNDQNVVNMDIAIHDNATSDHSSVTTCNIGTRTHEPSGDTENGRVCALVAMHKASEFKMTREESCGTNSDLPLGRMVHRHCVEMGTSPINASVAQRAPPATTSASAGCGVDVSTSPIESAKKSIPVYSRSLLYRIRVPLAQRLRNACSSFSEMQDSTCEEPGSANNSPTGLTGSLRLSLNELNSVSNRDSVSIRRDPSVDSTDTTSATESNSSSHRASLFFKTVRSISVDSAPKRRRSTRSSSTDGLLVSGELWRSGSMNYIGPDYGEPPAKKHTNRAEMLKELLLKHYYLCSGSKR